MAHGRRSSIGRPNRIFHNISVEMPNVKLNSDMSSRVVRSEQTAMKNGFRPCVFEKRGLYMGNWEKDLKQGKGKKFYKNKTIYEGDWAGNRKHGFGVLMKKVNDRYVYVYEGQWINNRFAQGKWYAMNGVYEGSFSTTSSRVKSGYGTMWWNDGTVYQGQWWNNKYDGRGQLVEANENIYNGQWRNGVKHGEGIYLFKDKGQFMEGVWIDGVPKISIIKYIDGLDVISGSIFIPKQHLAMPKISKDDGEDLQKAYEYTKLQILNTLI